MEESWCFALMEAEIISVGTELLLGQIANTNAQYLGEQLAALGIESSSHNHCW